MKNKEKIKAILEKLNDGLYEREEIVAVTLLAALCGEHAFLLGPPGTAKSLIARRISQAFETDKYFEVLMNRFSTPEDVFGPVSIKELKDDNYVRKTEGYLPEADFAFLDEIWKSSPAILNTLLTIVNERKFHNGAYGVLPVPLKSIVSASNETPPPNQGLEALYDRFAVRLHVNPTGEWDNFAKMLGSPTDTKVNVPSDLKIKNDEWKSWQDGIARVHLSDDTLKVIEMVRKELAQDSQREVAEQDKGKQAKKSKNGDTKEGIKDPAKELYVSDRLWQKATKLMKAAAFFCDRKETNLADALLLRHCLWSSDENRERVIERVEAAVMSFDFGEGDSDKKSSVLDKEKDGLADDVNEYLFYGADDYETVVINQKKYFSFEIQTYERGNVSLYAPEESIKSSHEFHPFNSDLNLIGEIGCKFKGGKKGGKFVITSNSWRLKENGNTVQSIGRPLKSLKGQKRPKSDQIQRVIEKFQEDADKLISKNEEIVKDILSQKKTASANEFDNPFIAEEAIKRTVLAGMERQLRVGEDRIEELKKTKALCL